MFLSGHIETNVNIVNNKHNWISEIQSSIFFGKFKGKKSLSEGREINHFITWQFRRLAEEYFENNLMCEYII